MELDDFKKSWKEQNAGNAAPLPVIQREETDLLSRKVKEFNKTIFWRDFRESAVAFFLAFYFSYKGVLSQDALGKAGHFLTAGAAVFIIIFLYVKKRQYGKAAYDDTVTGYLKKSLQEVNGQIWLLKNVAWWYILPIYLGISLKSIFLSDLKSNLIVLPSFILIGVFVYWLNQRAVKKYLLPLRKDIEDALRGIE